MSLYGSLFSGVTGLNAQSRALGDISENISNVNTVGFKAGTTQFSTLVTGGGDDGSVGGVKHIKIQKISAQGILQQTTNATDLGIAGKGFFVVNDNLQGAEALGSTMFSRAGHFTLNEDQNLVNAAGHGLMGWKLNSDGEFIDANNNTITPDPTSDSDLVPVNLGQVSFSSQATANIDIQASFPAQMVVSDTFEASTRIVDELSGGHRLEFDFTKSDHIDLQGTIDDGTNGVTNFFINDVATPAQLADGTTTAVTAVDLEFNFVSNVAGVKTFQVDVTADNGTVSAGTTTFNIQYDISNNLIGDSIRQVDVEWSGGLSANDSIIGIDFGSIVFDDTVAPTLDETDGGHVAPLVNEDGPLLKLDISTANADDVFVSGNSTFVQFNQDGALVSPTDLDIEINWANTGSFASNSTINLNIGTVGTKDGLSIGGDEFQLSSTSQDGIEFSPFQNATVDEDGVVFANFKNGTSLPVFRIPLADFNNPDGLRSQNGNAFISTLESGDFFLNVPGNGGVGAVTPQSLEQSTVDIAREFANMIVTQRAFSSASTVITTADEMLQELVQLKR